MAQQERLVIIGSGPAGYTAALYAARANLNPLLFEGMQPGGQLTITSDVENYPGFPEGILGPELMEKMKKQAERFGTRFELGDVTRADLSRRPFQLWQDDRLFTADAVIVATGASAKWLEIPSEKKYQGRGVSACATCDGFFRAGEGYFRPDGKGIIFQAVPNLPPSIFLEAKPNQYEYQIFTADLS